MSSAILLLLITAGTGLCLEPGPSPAETPESIHYRIEKSAPPVSSDFRAGIRLTLSSATLLPESLALRIRFENATALPLDSFGILTPRDFKLSSGKGGAATDFRAQTISPSIAVVSPAPGLLPALANSGTAIFPRPDSLDDLTLRVDGFDTVAFALAEDRRFAPVPASKLGAIRAGQTLTSNHPQLSLFPSHVSRVIFGKGSITFDVAFENATHRTLLNESGARFSGESAFLIDAEHRLHKPTEVSSSFRQFIGPLDTPWKPGGTHPGAITFPIPHEHALDELRFSFPSYDTLVLRYDRESGAFESSVSEIPAAGEENANPLLASTQVFDELTQLLERLSSHLQTGNHEAYLAGFPDGSVARSRQVTFLTMLALSPARDLELKLPAEQDLSPDGDGRVSDVKVYLDYRLEKFEEPDPFRIQLQCAFERLPGSGRWAITQYEFENQLPFWLLDFTRWTLSEHFYLFHRPQSISGDAIDKAEQQLEQAYRELSKNALLKLAPRYVVFFVDSQETFGKLTGREPMRFAGATTAWYDGSNDERFRVHNRVMYINDYRHLQPGAPFGLRERQKTITHELLHLALAPDTRPFSPPWLVEGVAVLQAGQNDRFTREELKRSGALNTISLSGMSRGPLSGAHAPSAQVLGHEYYYSAEAAAYILKMFGEERLFELYRSFGRFSPRQVEALARAAFDLKPADPIPLPKLMHHLTEEMTQNILGMDLYELDRAVKAHLSEKRF